MTGVAGQRVFLVSPDVVAHRRVISTFDIWVLRAGGREGAADANFHQGSYLGI